MPDCDAILRAYRESGLTPARSPWLSGLHMRGNPAAALALASDSRPTVVELERRTAAGLSPIHVAAELAGIEVPEMLALIQGWEGRDRRRFVNHEPSRLAAWQAGRDAAVCLAMPW